MLSKQVKAKVGNDQKIAQSAPASSVGEKNPKHRIRIKVFGSGCKNFNRQSTSDNNGVQIYGG